MKKIVLLILLLLVISMTLLFTAESAKAVPAKIKPALLREKAMDVFPATVD